MKQIRLHHVQVALFLTLLFSVYAVGCHTYVWRKTSKETIVNLKDKPLNIFLVDGSQPNRLGWSVKAQSMDQQYLKGTFKQLTPIEARQVRVIQGKKEERLSQYNIVFTLKKGYAQQLLRAPFDSIALDQVEKMEVYKYDAAGSAATTVLAVVGFTALAVVVIAVIAFATKAESCPFVYADNPDGRVFEGELYSGATYPQLERHDWLPMPHLQATGQTYRLAIANKVKEVQHTNLLELVAIDHPEQTEVLFDKYGRLHTLANPQAPVKATSLEGQDLLSQIAWQDSFIYLGTPNNNTPDASDGILLQFQRPDNAQSAKLVVNAKNSMWLDHAHGLMLDKFGDRAANIRENFLQKSAADLHQWALKQNIPLSVWIETTPGKWERADYFNLSGPMALKRDVLDLDLSKVKGDQIRIKLIYGFMFWEIDYVAMDFSPNQAVQVQNLAPVSAITQDGADLSAALRSDDAEYYHQPNIGDEAMVVFPAPPLKNGYQRSLILHAKGHYQILRDPKPGTPSLRELKKFRNPNAFPIFARDQWWQLLSPTSPSLTLHN